VPESEFQGGILVLALADLSYGIIELKKFLSSGTKKLRYGIITDKN
jgi:hypothetical protein